MDKQQSKKLKQQNPDLHELYQGLSMILGKYNLGCAQFCKKLRKYYVLQAFSKCKTISRTALKCGVDRRIVSEIIKDQEKRLNQSILHKILNKIERKALSNKGIVNKMGKKSIQSIMYKTANGTTTVNSIVMALVEMHCIEDMGSHIKFIGNSFSKPKNHELEQLSNKLNRCIVDLVGKA